MLKPHEIRQMAKALIEQLGRKTTEVTHLDTGELQEGDNIDSESVSTVNGGVVETKETNYKRLFECGHLARAGSVTATCDRCDRMVCEQCISLCEQCNYYICRYCARILVEKDSREALTLCRFPCYAEVNRNKILKQAGKSILRLFAPK
jgi:hypothetical protein